MSLPHPYTLLSSLLPHTHTPFYHHPPLIIVPQSVPTGGTGTQDNEMSVEAMLSLRHEHTHSNVRRSMEGTITIPCTTTCTTNTTLSTHPLTRTYSFQRSPQYGRYYYHYLYPYRIVSYHKYYSRNTTLSHTLTHS